uniref:Uncharacterized protein n=1 Tax=Rangifer tarandus platyrhynchus TaxID=3082113 RepID=A0ACB0DWI0_RANTA|nr:unnamed protein product [Rangifer tarandus platyrhynchus]
MDVSTGDRAEPHRSAERPPELRVAGAWRAAAKPPGGCAMLPSGGRELELSLHLPSPPDFCKLCRWAETPPAGRPGGSGKADLSFLSAPK